MKYTILTVHLSTRFFSLFLHLNTCIGILGLCLRCPMRFGHDRLETTLLFCHACGPLSLHFSVPSLCVEEKRPRIHCSYFCVHKISSCCIRYHHVAQSWNTRFGLDSSLQTLLLRVVATQFVFCLEIIIRKSRRTS